MSKKSKLFHNILPTNLTIFAAISVGCILAVQADEVQATILTFNSTQPSLNGANRSAWLNAIGVTPQHVVNFESGFFNNQNISGISGLFPGDLTITDTSPANEAIVRSGGGVIGGSNPIGAFALTQNEEPFLELDFSISPVDYLAFQDIDQSGTTGIVTFTDGSTANISFETTSGSSSSAEFFGIFRNDMPRISLIQLDASGDSLWGIDNIEYGVVPEPLTILGAGTAAGFGAFFKRTMNKKKKDKK